MYIKTVVSTSRYKEITEIILIPEEAELHLWTAVEGDFTLEQYYDSKDKKLLPVPPKPHISAVFDYETLQWVIPVEALIKDIKSSRKYLLTNSDGDIARYRDLDQPIPQRWLDYRQALRDITDQPGFPTNVIWPTRPTT